MNGEEINPSLPPRFSVWELFDEECIWEFFGSRGTLNTAKVKAKNSSGIRTVIRRESDGEIVWDSEQEKGAT